VRGTVRDTKNEKKVAPLRRAFGDKFSELQLAEADLLNAESLDKAIEGMEFVVHTASPFPLDNPKDENVLIHPAVEGTLAVMRAAHKHKVKRVVITSSVAAVMFKKPENVKDLYDEEDWSDVEACSPYEKSKTLAEKAAWEFLNGLPESERFELVTINPVLILGPSLIAGDFTSASIITQLMSGKYPGMPKV
jgi:dihydroflavonol-4-reductase